MDYKDGNGQKQYALRCDYFDGFVYAPCEAFIYEPGTDIGEMK